MKMLGLSSLGRSAVFLVWIAFVPVGAVAAEVTWDGTDGNGLWETCTNWNTDRCPGAEDRVIVEGAAGVVSARSDVSVTSLLLKDGTLDLRAAPVVTVGGSVTQTGGVFFLPSSRISVGGDVLQRGGSMVPSASTELVLEGSGDQNVQLSSWAPSIVVEKPSGAARLLGPAICSVAAVRVRQGVLVMSAAELIADRLEVSPGGTVRAGSGTLTVSDIAVDGGSLEVPAGQLRSVDRGAVALLAEDACGKKPSSSSARERSPLISALSRAADAVGGTPTRAATSALAVTSAIAVAGTLTALPTLSSEALLKVLPAFAVFRKRRRRTGRVIDERDGRPLGGAWVEVFDAWHKLRERVRCNHQGIFGVLLPAGEFSIQPHRPGYTHMESISPNLLFPWELFVGTRPFTIVAGEKVLPFVLAMKRITPPTRRERIGARVRVAFLAAQVTLARMSVPLLLLGGALSIFTLLRERSALSVLLAVTYVVFLSLELLLMRVFGRSVGRILEYGRGNPVALAAVRLMDHQTHAIIQTRLTTPGGRYFILAPRGAYEMHVVHPQFLPAMERVTITRPGTPVVRNVELTSPPSTETPKAAGD